MANVNKSILIIRRDNIGDLVLTTPMFEALRRRYPDAYIAVLVNSYNAPAIAGNPFVDDIFAYTKGKHAGGSVLGAHWRRLQLIWRLRRQRFDVVILPNGGFAARALSFARLLKPRRIVGFCSGAAPAGLSVPIAHAGGEHLHETEDICRLLAPLDVSGPIPGLTVLPDRALADKISAGLPAAFTRAAGLVVALHLSARKEKQRWPVERFTELARHLHAAHGARFLVFWSPGDENNPFHPGDDGKAARLLGDIADLPVAPVRTAALAELIAGLSLADYAVLSDGGAMHLAAGLGKPLVCFFGNSPASRWHPWGVPYQLLQKPSEDVGDISVEETLQAFARLLASAA
jgi:ADP-heptose:LPS heptosyltransferase